MKFAKFVGNIRICDPSLIVNFEIFVGDSFGLWKWFDETTIEEYKTLLKPIVEEFLATKGKHLSNKYNSSTIECLAGPSVQIAYFFKKEPFLFNPCLIKCEKEMKYKPVNVSQIRLMSSMCPFLSPSILDSQNAILSSQLKKSLGTVLSEPTVISNYFQKIKKENTVQHQNNLEKVETESNYQMSNEGEEIPKQANLNQKSMLNIQNTKKTSFDDDDDFETKENTPLCVIDTIKRYKVVSQTKVTDYLSESKNVASATLDSQNESSYYENIVEQFGGGPMGNESRATKTSVNEVKSKTSKYFDSSKRKLEFSETENSVSDEERWTNSILNELEKPVISDEEKRAKSILNELEKPDPEIDRLVAASKVKTKCKRKKFTPTSTGWFSKDDSFDIFTSGKRYRKLKRPNVAKKNGGKGNVEKSVKRDTITLRKIGISSSVTKVSNTKTVVNEIVSDSDDELPIGLDLDNEPVMSNKEILENLTQLQNTKRKEADSDDDVCRVLSECSNKSSDSEESSKIKAGTIAEFQSLSTERLEILIEENVTYFREILKGKRYSRRHQDYIKGGKIRQNLASHVFLSMYTDDQVNFVLLKLMAVFCKKNPKLNDYMYRVLLTEALIKIIMVYKGLEFDDAEKMLFMARFTD